MSAELILVCIAGYFSLLLLIAWYTGRNANEQGYFIGNKKSPWYAVAFGMIGDSLSGVTFISVPGAVLLAHFGYMQLVFGYFFGYFVISEILLPLYYRLNLTSIYTYLQQRFGNVSQKTGSFFFLLSRIAGAGARLFLAAGVMQMFVFDSFGIPFWLSVSIIIILILIYTYRGGIKTLVWTDAFQSSFLLLGVILSIVAISSAMHFNFGDMISAVRHSEHTELFFWDWKLKSFFPKQFLGGMFIAITMSGLDQNMMQKNLSMEGSKYATRNMRTFAFIVVAVNLLFLALGALLYIYAYSHNVSLPMNGEAVDTDKVFPFLALERLGTFAGLVFIIGLTAATFNSADSVLTALTTSFYIDFLGMDKKENVNAKRKNNIRHIIHVLFAVLLLFTILLFEMMNKQAIIDTVLKVATYTYAPLLGIFAFGILTKRKTNETLVPFICLVIPALCYLIDINSKEWFGGYQFGNEMLILNGGLIFLALLFTSGKQTDILISHS